jgi:hypothetical protein
MIKKNIGQFLILQFFHPKKHSFTMLKWLKKERPCASLLLFDVNNIMTMLAITLTLSCPYMVSFTLFYVLFEQNAFIKILYRERIFPSFPVLVFEHC